jgi:hypothetical protein
MKKITLLLAFLVTGMFTMAQMSGTYTVGTGGTYETLKSAVDAVNSAGISGDVTLSIISSITEPADISLGVNTGSNKLIIKPAVGVSPTITFTNTGASVSIDGHFVIGSPNANSANLVSTNNVVIDGSNTVGGTTKDLTIIGSASSTARGVIRIFGNCDDVTIKNCIITGKNTSGSNNGCVHVTNYNASSVNYNPDRLIIENNTLTNVDGNGAAAIHVSNSGTPTVGMIGLKVINNIVNGRVRGMFISYTNDGDIYGNTISEISQTDQGSAAITLQTNFGTAGTFNVYNNKIIALTTINKTAGANNGVIGIDNQCITPKVVNIYNNTISGMNVGNAATTNSKIYGIRVTSTSTCNVFHNTIYLPEMTDMTTFGTSLIAGIVLATAATTEASPPAAAVITVKNNVVVGNESTMKTWCVRRVGTLGTITFDNNLYYQSNTTNGFIGYFNTSDATDLAAWKTASSQDANSKSGNVSFVNAAIGNLDIAPASYQDANLQVTRLAEVPNDINGNPRYRETYKGAYESEMFIINDNASPVVSASILRTYEGVQIELEGTSTVEIYTTSGMLIDKVRTSGTYTKDLNNGVYIIRIDGQATKFMK